ncbi:MAG: thioesterase family protein [Proteobacteria bacterium]|nr:thioesterase family protein [Pseudomonadota bacterium]
MQPYPGYLTRHETVVRPEWIDYNGHMNLAYYVVVFDEATDVMFDHIGIGMSSSHRAGMTTFAAESHTRYLAEVKLGDPLAIFTHLLGVDGKRVHYFHEMFHARDGYRAAVQELMSLHIDLATRRVANLPEEKLAPLRAYAAQRGDAPPPPDVGRRIAMPG